MPPGEVAVKRLPVPRADIGDGGDLVQGGGGHQGSTSKVVVVSTKWAIPENIRAIVDARRQRGSQLPSELNTSDDRQHFILRPVPV